MGFKCFFICSLLQVFPLAISKAPASCSEADRAALLGFKAKILKDSTDSFSSWIGRDCCGGDWEGVECNPPGRVNRLALQRPVRDGPIPESLSNLTRLKQLVLEDNGLQGNIPSGLGHLPSLQTLSLAGNHLTGAVPPSLGNLRNLVLLNLGRNSLTGPIPSSFKTLVHLQSFDLSFNLLSGSVPEFLGQFHNITFIDLSNNQLSGHLPVPMFNLVTLSDLSLSHNQLTGSIPDQVGNLKSLNSLSLSHNKFIGPIPGSIAGLQKLWSLNLSRNGLSNPLPAISSKGIPSLLSIDLSFNNLSLGTVPNWIIDRQLSDVNLAGCKLRGAFPKFRPDSLSSIDLSDNFFTGSIATYFTNMTSLQKLKLSNNQLNFDLSELILPDGISTVDLHSNQVLGSLSSVLNSRTSGFLEVIDVSNNLISGTIPEFTEGLSLKAGCFEEPDKRHHSYEFRTTGETSMARRFRQPAHRGNPEQLIGLSP
ncbi:High-mobility group box 6 [Hibiscus syriacus]|uniref:High-mobility group box 6 n=1 Tax=Hibiscus syriacus TaxID=106335 RepID=A0A6A2ZZS7_HIBSY|nr:High-mobility group box 6 [Hibiscus syriacus]